MITIIFEDNIDFYFARQRVPERLDPGQHVPAAGRRALPGPRRHGPGPDLLVHGRGQPDATRSIRAGCGRSTSSTSRRSSTRRRAWPRWRSSAARRWSTRSTCGPKTLRAYGVTLGELFAAVAQSNMPAGGGVIQKNNAEYIVRGVGWIKDKHGHREHGRQGGQRHADLRQDRRHGAARRAVPPQRLREGRQRGGRRRGADAARRESAGGHRAGQGEDSGAAAGPAARACASCRSTTARG